jgi:hypothetical protein
LLETTRFSIIRGLALQVGKPFSMRSLECWAIELRINTRINFIVG